MFQTVNRDKSSDHTYCFNIKPQVGDFKISLAETDIKIALLEPSCKHETLLKRFFFIFSLAQPLTETHKPKLSKAKKSLACHHVPLPSIFPPKPSSKCNQFPINPARYPLMWMEKIIQKLANHLLCIG